MKNNSEIIMYQTDDGIVKIDVILDDNTVWLSQNQMAILFGKSLSTINEHIKNIYVDQEVSKAGSMKKFGKSEFSIKPTTYYNLDIIISVGYRVKSLQGVRFRRWATERLKEYLIQGFSINDEFLKNNGGGLYWKKLLNRIRDIRSSEKVLYRQVLDLYSTSVDYNPHTLESIKFFKIVQNKLHYATHGNTAAEIIYNRVDSTKDFLGLTNFNGEYPTREESYVAKNYLNKDELEKLNRLVSAFFDLAEMKAMEHIPMYMDDWINELNKFLSNYGNGVLTDSGKISNENAINKQILNVINIKID